MLSLRRIETVSEDREYILEVNESYIESVQEWMDNAVKEHMKDVVCPTITEEIIAKAYVDATLPDEWTITHEYYYDLSKPSNYKMTLGQWLWDLINDDVWACDYDVLDCTTDDTEDSVENDIGATVEYD